MFKTIKRFINWTGDYKKRLYIGFVYSFFVSLFAVVPVMLGAYSLMLVVQDLRGEVKLSNGNIWLLLGLMILFVLLRFLFSYLRAKTQESVGYEIAAQERMEIGNILKRVPLGYFRKNNTGDISATITTQLTFMELLGLKMLDIIVNGYINVFVVIICLAFFNIPIALISIGGVLLSGVFIKILNRFSEKTSPVVHDAQEKMTKATIEYLRGMSVVKSFGMTGASVKSVKEAYKKSRKVNIRGEIQFAPITALHLFALKLASTGIVWFASLMVLNAQAPIQFADFFGIPVMMVIFSFSLFAHVESVNDSAHVLGLIDSTLNNLENLKNTEFIDSNGRDVSIDSYDIAFENVTFSYEDIQVIKDLTLKIPQGKTTAIVGPSGSGKTTLCNLIARFYDVDRGRITVGNHDIREFTCDSLLSHISMVFQNVYLFHDTVRNNIKFGKADATEDEIIEAAKKARCHDFIMELPYGYDTKIGEMGSSLSGGEKQRISIARAVLKDAPIIILDEATASIDPENEYLIQSALSELTRGKTIIMIAHRLATIENADQIVVLDEGRIVQNGRHEQLINEKGVYRKFLDIRMEAENWAI